MKTHIGSVTLHACEYIEGCENYDGVCTRCGNIQSGVEPDAEGYICEDCGACAVCGLEQGLLLGVVQIVED